MRRPLSLVSPSIFAAAVLAACGGGTTTTPDAGPDPSGFTPPKKTLKANMEVTSGQWMELGDADLSCLNTKTADAPTSVAVTLNTSVLDFQTAKPVPLASVTAFPGIDSAHPFDTKMSDANGLISFAIPTGITRFGFKMTQADQFDTLLLFQYVEPAVATQTVPTKIQSVSHGTGNALPALVGVSRTLGTGVVAGALRDCQHREISNYIATVSSTQGTATTLTGSQAYYFSPTVGLPDRHTRQPAASGDGLFMAIEVPATPTAYVQMWGYPTQADLTAGTLKLIAELQVPVIADTVITGSYEPNRTP
jgi:hypothetical protein